MKFVLCSNTTYQEQYQAEAYKWVKVQDHKDLLGFRNVHVTIHDCWMYELSDERVDYLEQQLTALADFGYISITYQSEDGWSENYEREESAPTEKQLDLPLDNPSAVVAYEVEDNDCEGGACKI